ncbi:DUF6802 family protein [Dietzia sp. 179-F 9C3 NHS]|uniref:DUF6802 family protein n=1 Tax=Dietzia sp. 179-F 9C3 NHS TaxID=3374295 RepID=UPI00387A3293
MTDPLFGPDSPHHAESPDVCGLEGAHLAAPDSLGLHVPVAGGVLDLGSPEADLDGDGFMEAVTLQDVRGLTVYTDVDGDGTVDHVSTVRFDGSYDSWRLTNPIAGVPFGGFTNEPSTSTPTPARWERTDHGHI